MKKSVIFFLAIAIAAIFGLLYLRLPKEKIPQSGELAVVEATNANLASLQPAVSPIDVSNNVQSTKAINATSAPVQIMEKTPQQIIAEKNNQPQDLYGKVIDQYEQPVIDADVSATLIIETDDGFKTKSFTSQTDANGLFQFTEIRGADLNVKIKKDGYKLGDKGEGYQGPIGGISNPNNRAIYTMWKIRGAEPLIGSSIDVKIPHDGTPATFEMATGKESPNGDFRVTLSQYPLDVQKGWERFDWSVKVEILNGGLVEENDSYPFWAPTDGYQPSFEFNESTNAVKWLGGLQKTFYIKTGQGQYGLMQLKIFPGRSPTGLEVNFTINPSGSQNLEPDFSK